MGHFPLYCYFLLFVTVIPYITTNAMPTHLSFLFRNNGKVSFFIIVKITLVKISTAPKSVLIVCKSLPSLSNPFLPLLRGKNCNHFLCILSEMFYAYTTYTYLHFLYTHCSTICSFHLKLFLKHCFI